MKLRWASANRSRAAQKRIGRAEVHAQRRRESSGLVAGARNLWQQKN